MVLDDLYMKYGRKLHTMTFCYTIYRFQHLSYALPELLTPSPLLCADVSDRCFSQSDTTEYRMKILESNLYCFVMHIVQYCLATFDHYIVLFCMYPHGLYSLLDL